MLKQPNALLALAAAVATASCGGSELTLRSIKTPLAQGQQPVDFRVAEGNAQLARGNVGLAIVTLGFGLAFWGYRNWAFMVRHMHLYGVVNLDQLTRSTVAAPREAEGWADAFDVGAI